MLKAYSEHTKMFYPRNSTHVSCKDGCVIRILIYQSAFDDIYHSYRATLKIKFSEDFHVLQQLKSRRDERERVPVLEGLCRSIPGSR